jgi:hypothetical protein
MLTGSVLGAGTRRMVHVSNVPTPRHRNWRTGAQKANSWQLGRTHAAIGHGGLCPDMIFARHSLDGVGIVGCGDCWDRNMPIIAGEYHFASQEWGLRSFQ